jgi:hypothetical protein
MRTLLADSALTARLGAEGRARVSHEFGIDRLAEDSLRLYRGLLAGKSPREASAAEDRERSGSGALIPAEDPVR